jgi:hypothetical protein
MTLIFLQLYGNFKAHIMKNLKTLFCLALVALLQLPAASQVTPQKKWTAIDWPVVEPTTNKVQTQLESGEDWWYDHANVFDLNGNQTGYIAAGFHQGVNRDDDYELSEGGCYSCFKNDRKPVCHYFETPENMRTCIRGLIFEYDINGNMKWCRSYNSGELQSIIQTSDGGFLATGFTWSTRNVNNPNSWVSGIRGRRPGESGPEIQALIYNPDGSESHTFGSCSDYELNNSSGNPVTQYKRPVLLKLDKNGKIEWNYQYGIEDFTGIGEDAYRQAFGNWVDVAEINKSFYLTTKLTSYDDNNGVQQVDQNATVLIRVQPNGLISGKTIIQTSSALQSRGIFNVRSIINKPGTNTIFLGGIFEPNAIGGVPQRTEAYVGRFNIAQFPNNVLRLWDKTFAQAGENNVITHLAWKSGTNNVIAPILRNCGEGCLFAGNNQGTGEVFVLNESNGSTVTSNSIGRVNAFDIKFGVTATADGGYATITSRGPDHDNDGVLDPPSPSDPDIAPYLPSGCNSFDFNYWDTDAYVAKFDANDNLEWSETFDSHDNVRQAYPGDLKKQECMYAITEDQGTGNLVVSGNSSHNFDDCLLMKLSDCQVAITDYFDEEDGENMSSIDYFNESLDLRGVEHNEIIIKNSTFWGAGTIGDKKIKGVVRVKDGATLTVDGVTLEFAEKGASGQWSFILVEPGGKLVAQNGAKFTSMQDCPGSTWAGLQVANSNSEGTVKFGEIDLNGTAQNPIVIENAEDGIRTGDVFNIQDNYWFSFGGKVYADHVDFINNLRDVEIMKWEPYSGYISALGTSYPAHFSNCTFTKNQVFNKPRIGRPGSITLWDVHSIEFEDCIWDFTGVDYEEQDVLAAIYTYDASFKVYGTATEGLATSRFENCHYGIFSQKTWNYTSTIEVENSLFDDTKKGFFAYGADGYLLNNNEFKIPSLPRDREDLIDAYAVFIRAPSTYTIKNNTFTGALGSGFNTGVICRNNWGSNEVENNKFENLTVAIEANLENQDEGRKFGLQALCNNLNGNIRDIYSTHKPLSSALLNQQNLKTGMALNQGSDVDPAGNLFTNTLGLQAHIDNSNVSNTVLYFHHDPNFGSNSPRLEPTQIAFTAGQVFPLPFGVQENCPSTGSGIFFKTNIEEDLATYNAEIADKENFIDNTLDDGDTEGLIQMIEAAQPGDVANIYNYLMTLAPYLSQEVLEALVSNENFLPEMIRNLLVLCTHAAKDQNFVDLLGNRGDISPAYMEDILIAAQGLSDYELFLSQLAYAYHGKYNAVEDLYRWHIQNVDMSTYSELISLFGDQNNAYYQYRKAALQMQEGHFTDAANTLTAMETMDLGPLSMRFHSDYKDWQVLLENYLSFDFSASTSYSLSAAEETLLTDLKSNSEHPLNPAALAFENKLKEMERLDAGILFTPDVQIASIDPVHMPGVNYYKNDAPKTIAPKAPFAEENPLSIYPNPSSQYFTIKWLGAKNGQVQLLDLQGRVLQGIDLTEGIGILNTAADLPNGMYLIRVSSVKGEVRTQKVVLQR